VTNLPVRILINTHYHDDHIGGNPHWRARGATILAQHNLVEEARKDTTITELEWHRTPASPQALPDRTFDDSLTLDHEGQAVILLHPPAAHTSGDAMIWLPGLNIIHTGDLLEISAPPFLDWWGGGTLDGMIAGIDQALRITNALTLYVPGHGDPVRRDVVIAYRAMLVAARERITPKVIAGETPAAIAAALPLADYDGRFGGARYTARFVRIIAMGLARSK
jgi:glyoxylase-like metal-dependent hydrolase (beta-lactamase superfamily II)